MCTNAVGSGSVPHMLFIIAVSIFYIFQLFSFALSLPRLLEIYRFYTYLLGIPDVSLNHSTKAFALTQDRRTFKPFLGQRSSDSLATFASITP